MMILALPIAAQKRIATAAKAAVIEVEKLSAARPLLRGPFKKNRAEVMVIRALKAPEEGGGVGGGMPPGVREMLSQLDPEKVGEAAGEVVEGIAAAVEENENCKCDRRALALLRAIVQTAVETAVGFI